MEVVLQCPVESGKRIKAPATETGAQPDVLQAVFPHMGHISDGKQAIFMENDW